MNFYQIHYIQDCKPVTSKVQAGNMLSAIGVLGQDASTIYKIELVWTQTVDVPSRYSVDDHIEDVQAD